MPYRPSRIGTSACRRFARTAFFHVVIFFALLGSAQSLFAQGVGQFSSAFLRINPQARQVAMGEAFTGLADNYNLLRYNIAGLGRIHKGIAALNGQSWIESTGQMDVEIAFPQILFGFAFGGGLTVFDEGKLVELNQDFGETGRILRSYDAMLTFGIGRRFTFNKHNFSVGGGAKVIRQHLGGDSNEATGVGADGGLLYWNGPVSVGATYQNFTLKKMSFVNTEESLPEAIRGGVAFTLPTTGQLALTLTGDVMKIRNEQDLRYYAGGELKISEVLSLRGGYKFHDTEATRWAAGFGLNVPTKRLAKSSLDIDYAFSPLDNFSGAAHRFTLAFTFGLDFPERQVAGPGMPPALLDSLRNAMKDLENAQSRTRQLEEEMASRLERIKQIALTSAGKIEIIPDKDGTTVDTLRLRINFAFDKSDIRPTDFGTMSKVAEILNELPDSKLLLTGHTDAIGTHEYNWRLSMRRLQSVKEFLVDRGDVSDGRFLKLIPYGKTKPIADNSTPAGQALNRRVDFIFLDSDYAAEDIPGSGVETIQAVNDTTFAIVFNGVVEGKYEIKEYGLTNKFIIEFPGLYNLTAQRNYEINRGAVIRARAGYHPGENYTRVVFDLTREGVASVRRVNNSMVITIR